RSVKVGSAASGELVEVVEGLEETDKLICGGREGLRDGERIEVTGEDATQGVSGTGGAGPKRVKRLTAADAAAKPKQ
ncbi:hypothetical protein ACEV8Z_24185, partial [Vibrio parahaemolyticus]